VRIDTYGKSKEGIYKYLKRIYKKKYKTFTPKYYDELAVEDLASNEANQIMSEVSQTFIESIYGEVETCVCGAAFDRVFYQVELQALIDNDKITTINGIPRTKLKKLLGTGDEESKHKVFTEICLGELTLIYNRSKNAPDEETKEIWMDDYKGRLSFFNMEQKETAEARMKKVIETVKAVNDDNYPNLPDKSMYKKASGSKFDLN